MAIPEYLTKKDVLRIAEKENTVRLSEEYIRKCDEVAGEVDGWLRITEEMQEQLLRDHGITDPVANKIATIEYRSKILGYRGEPEIDNLLYVKENKAGECPYRKDDPVPEFILYDTRLNPHPLSSLMAPKTLVLAGSHT